MSKKEILLGCAKEVRGYMRGSKGNRLKVGRVLLKAKEQFGSQIEFAEWRVRTFADDLPRVYAYTAIHLAEVFPKGLPPKIPESGCIMLAAPGNRKFLDQCLDMLGKIKGPVLVVDVRHALAIAKGQGDRRLVYRFNHHVKIEEETYEMLVELGNYFDLPNNSLTATECIREMHDYYLGEKQKRA